MIRDSNDLAPRLESLLRAHPDWLKTGACVCLAISGGSDSIALADLMIRLSARWDWKLIGLHFDHELRGAEESQKDVDFVKEFFDSRHLQLVIGSKSRPFDPELKPVPERKLKLNLKLNLKSKKGSMEMSARDQRHRFLASQALNVKADRLALAHHQDDQHELFWIRLLRGASFQGIAGMPPMAPSPADPNLTMLRPLLSFSKAQILQYLDYRGLKYREDSSNQSLDPLRNRIRQQLIPNLSQNYQPGIRSVTERWINTARETQEFLSQELQKRLAQENTEPFKNWPRVIQKLKIADDLPKIGKKPQNQLVDWLLDHPDHWMELSPGRRVRLIESGGLELEETPIMPEIKAEEAEDAYSVSGSYGDCEGESYAIDFTRSGKLSTSEFDLEWVVEESENTQNDRATMNLGAEIGSRALNLERFDLAKIGSKGWIRRVKGSDRFHPIGAPGPRSMKKYLSGLGIPANIRNRSWVAVNENGEIFWNQFGRISELFRLDKSTSQRLLWRFTRAPKTIHE